MSSGKNVRKWSALALGAALLFSTAGVVQASAERCDERIHKAEHKLAEAVRKHGEHSKQAEKRRRELEDARVHCHV